MEDIETAIAAIHAEDEAVDPPKSGPAKPHNANRGSLPKYLPRVEEVIEPEASVRGCGGGLRQIGEDVSERLDVIPAQFRVIVIHRPKYACRSCSNCVVQAPSPARLIVIFDALRVKNRDADSRMVKNKAVYVALGVNRDSLREVLGRWIADDEGAKFWLSMMNELKSRGF